METILQAIIRNIELITTIVVSVSALIVLIITKYKEAIDILKAKKELTAATIPLIGEAKTNAIGLAETLVNKDAVNFSPALLRNEPDDTKKNVVAQALIEREPKLLRKLKLKDLFQVGNFVSGVYQTVKPIIKAWK